MINGIDRLTLKDLCDIGTELTFIRINNNNSQTIVMTDIFDIKSHGFATYFYLALSLMSNPWILVLSNALIGLPVDQLGKLLERFHRFHNIDPLTGELRYSRQLIVVSRCPQAYGNLFKQNYKQF